MKARLIVLSSLSIYFHSENTFLNIFLKDVHNALKLSIINIVVCFLFSISYSLFLRNDHVGSVEIQKKGDE